MNRRDFIKISSIVPFGLNPFLKVSASANQKYLVLIELKGGNDGLNTLIPYSNDKYYESRPNIHIKKEDVITLNKDLGLNPKLRGLKGLFDEGDLAIIQNVGYEKVNLSHFTSLDIWERGSYDRLDNSGWLYKIFRENNKKFLTDGIVFRGSTGALNGGKPEFLKVGNLQSFIKHGSRIRPEKDANKIKTFNSLQTHLYRSQKLTLKVASKFNDVIDIDSIGKINNKSLNDQMKQTAEIIKSGVDIPVIKLGLKNFDTHANQFDEHQNLLGELDKAIRALKKSLSLNEWVNTLVVTYSEFGRRVDENGSMGTDHGEASCLFCMGGSVKGGIFGDNPDLTNVHNNNLIYKTDFREIYATIENNWFGYDKKIFDDFTGLNFI